MRSLRSATTRSTLALLAAIPLVALAACSSSSSTSAAPAGDSTASATTAPPATPATEAPTTAAPTTAAPPTTAAATTTTAPPAPTSPARTVKDLLALGRPIILAHAGGEDTAPHSTPYAFGEAVKAGVDVLDFDLQLSKDGVLVVQHDDHTGRTTQQDLVVADSTFEQLHALDDAYWFTATCTCTDQPDSAYVLRGIRTGSVPPPAGYTPEDFAIPSFETYVRKYPDYVLNIEIKGTAPAAFATADALAALLRSTGALDRAVVTSFDDQVVDYFHSIAPEVVMTPGLQMSTDFVLGGTTPPPWAPIMQVPPEYQGLKVFTADYVAKAHAAGLVTWVWPNGVGEDVAGYRALLDLGAEGVNASDPAAGVAARDAFVAGR